MKTNRGYEMGHVYATIGVNTAMDESEIFKNEVDRAFIMYRNHDWGNLPNEDKELNNNAVTNPGTDRILAGYDTSKGRIYIITEAEQSVTTILFAKEY